MAHDMFICIIKDSALYVGVGTDALHLYAYKAPYIA